MTEPAPPDAAPDPAVIEADFPGSTPGHLAFLTSMQGYCRTLAAIGSPDAMAALEAMTAAMNGLSDAFNLASAAMAAATPTSH